MPYKNKETRRKKALAWNVRNRLQKNENDAIYRWRKRLKMKEEKASIKLTIGADPEFFVQKKDKWISGHIFQCGNKAQPMKTEHGSIQVDGLALECNVIPAESKEEFLKNVYDAFGDLRKFVKSVDADCDIIPAACVHFGNRYIASLPKEIQKLGCTPDYNAYTGKVNPSPEELSPYRTGSGHIHIGWTKDANVRELGHFKKCCELVKQLDYYLALPSLKWDDDHKRRMLYGKAGAFRPKSYGVEYRVLSNKWMDSPELAGFVYDATVRAVSDFDKGIRLWDTYKDTARTWVNTNLAGWDKHGNMGPVLAKELLV